MKKVMLLGVALCLAWAHTPAEASLTYSFYAVTNNSSIDPGIGEALFVDVSNPGGSQTLFTFRNVEPENSSITDVYFDDGALLRIASIINTASKVEFSQLANPGDLPGGNNISPAFEVTESFSADSDSPINSNGMNLEEELGILFDLEAGKTYGDVLSDLESTALRIGIHVQGFDDGKSESFVKNRIIPGAGAIFLGSIGVGLVGGNAEVTIIGMAAPKRALQLCLLKSLYMKELPTSSNAIQGRNLPWLMTRDYN